MRETSNQIQLDSGLDELVPNESCAAPNKPKHDARFLGKRMRNEGWPKEKSSLNPACRCQREMSHLYMRQAGLRALAKRYAPPQQSGVVPSAAVC
jgi:hypothetical protein